VLNLAGVDEAVLPARIQEVSSIVEANRYRIWTEVENQPGRGGYKWLMRPGSEAKMVITKSPLVAATANRDRDENPPPAQAITDACPQGTLKRTQPDGNPGRQFGQQHLAQALAARPARLDGPTATLSGRSLLGGQEPVGLNYFRFHEEEFAILQMLDGHTSLERDQGTIRGGIRASENHLSGSAAVHRHAAP
jgi:hypothetical protein